ncbi:unnamed protein product, partial [Echinostoma caproni]|uniref:Threonylcarbamoyl-AMP synthase n=1 Tax=Echinostoma caproni TaxID=27848 RepID=A0A182ZZL0_9TREM
VSSISHWCDTRGLPGGLLSALLPGPVTVVLPRLSNDPLNRELNPGVSSVGVRVPDCGFVQQLVYALRSHEGAFCNTSDPDKDHPLVLTSANLSGDTSTLNVEEFRVIWPLLDVVIDGGSIAPPPGSNPDAARAGSTIVDLCSVGTGQEYRVVRTGRYRLGADSTHTDSHYSARRGIWAFGLANSSESGLFLSAASSDRPGVIFILSSPFTKSNSVRS